MKTPEYNNMNNQKISDDVIIEDAINCAFLSVQKAIGQDDGGVASLWMSGSNGELLHLKLQEYLEFERAYKDFKH